MACLIPDILPLVFNPVKSSVLAPDGLSLISDQIKSYRPADMRVAFGFLLDSNPRWPRARALKCQTPFSNYMAVLPYFFHSKKVVGYFQIKRLEPACARNPIPSGTPAADAPGPSDSRGC